MANPQFEAFVAPARVRPQIWRLIVGIFLSLVVYALVVFAIFFGYWAINGGGADLTWAEDLLDASSPQAMLLLLSTFLGMALGPMVAVKLLHKRKAGTLFGRAARTLRDFCIAACVVAAVLSISILVWSFQYDALPGIDFSVWLVFLPFALLGILIQTGAEELFFRGYLQQQLAARFASPFVWILIPSLIFGFVHYDPQSAGSSVWIVVGAAAFFGLVAADLTARTGSIGAAWGFHFANNTIALLVISTQGTLTGLALKLTPYSIEETDQLMGLVVFDLALMVLAWVILRRVLRP